MRYRVPDEKYGDDEKSGQLSLDIPPYGATCGGPRVILEVLYSDFEVNVTTRKV